jgi:hypothetical protein
MVATASVVLPLALVAASLTYRGGVWLFVALAVGAAASVALVELSAGDRSAKGAQVLEFRVSKNSK